MTLHSQTPRYPFQNPDLDMEKRIDNLLSLMSREEKIRCLSTVPDVPRLGVRGTGHVEGLHGLALGEVAGWGGGAPVSTTQFPQAIGLGETWDPDLVRQIGRAEGRETRYIWESPKYGRGGLVVRAPNADLGRDPRWGRTEECFGEDPFLNGSMAVAMTRGLQGDDKRYLQCASLLKHFLANSNENDRVKSSSDFDERLFREYYSVPFRMAIEEGGAQGVMAAYNAVNKVPCTVSPFLRNVVVGEWGFDGILCTDGGALGLLVREHHYTNDLKVAAASCVKAGINQFLDRHDQATRGALARGLLRDAEMDEALRGVFRVMIRLGMLDPANRVPYRKVGKVDPWETEEHKALALLASRKSVVLLKNDADLLPLDPAGIRTVAVIGPYANRVLPDWYSGDAPYQVSPLEGIRRRLGPGVKVRFAKNDEDGAAVELARVSDVVIVCAGNHPTGNRGWAQRDSPAEGKEGMDRDSMELRQEDLIRRALAVNPKTIVAVVGSFPFTMGWTADHAPAILRLAHSGQETGTALAGAIFGDFNPGGRLTQTWPKSMKQLPPMMDYDIRHGRTYMYFKGEPLYPFGFGLSYTTFRYSNLRLGAGRVSPSGSVTLSVDLTNTGARAGDETAQLYVSFPESSVERPRLALRAFRRVTIPPGKTRAVTFRLRAKDLAYWDARTGGWKVEPGRVQVRVGPSSAELPLEADLEVLGGRR